MDVLLNPDKFFTEHREMSFRVPIAIVTVLAVISAILAYSVVQIVLEKVPPTQEALNAVLFLSVFTGISAFVGVFLSWIISTAILYILSAIFRGKGKFTSLMKFSAFGFIPAIILSPINFYISAELFRSPTVENLYAAVVLSGIAFAWQFVYLVFAVKNARELSVKKSAIVCAIPIVLGFAYSIHSMGTQLEILKMLAQA